MVNLKFGPIEYYGPDREDLEVRVYEILPDGTEYHIGELYRPYDSPDWETSALILSSGEYLAADAGFNGSLEDIREQLQRQ